MFSFPPLLGIYLNQYVYIGENAQVNRVCVCVCVCVCKFTCTQGNLHITCITLVHRCGVFQS